MKRSDPIQKSDEAFSAQLQIFKFNIRTYADTLGLTPAQIAAQAADADYFTYVLACQEIMRNSPQQWTLWKRLLRGGSTPPITGVPVTPKFPSAVPAVAPGIEARFLALVESIRKNPNYNASIGEALGIEEPRPTGPDLATVPSQVDAQMSGNRGDVSIGQGEPTRFSAMR